MELIQHGFSFLQRTCLLAAFLSGAISAFLFFRQKTGYSLIFLFLAGVMLRSVVAGLDHFLWPWDEQFHALVAKNMLNNPFKPVLISHPALPYDFRNWQENHIWLHKQPFFLWQIALFFKLFGVSEFVLRLPTVLMMSGMILLIYRIGKQTASTSVGWYGAFIYTFACYFVQLCSGWKFTDHNDAAFIFYVTLSIWAWVEFFHSGRKRWLILIGFFAGIAVLNKWLTGLLVYAGWMVSILWCRKRSEWPREFRQIGISVLVAVITVLPWQIYTLMAFPVESRFEFIYSGWHFSQALDGHGETWYYHFTLLAEQYRGRIAWIMILPGLWFYLRSMKDKLFKVSILTWLIVTYAFFTLAGTKMPLYCAIVSPLLFLCLGAILAMGMEKLKEYTPLFSDYLFTILLLLLSYILLDIHSLDEWNSDKFSSWKRNNLNAIIDREAARKFPPGDLVVFNCGRNNPVMLMFYSHAVAYGRYPTPEEYRLVKSSGVRIATFADAEMPPYLGQDPSVIRIYLKPIPY